MASPQLELGGSTSRMRHIKGTSEGKVRINLTATTAESWAVGSVAVWADRTSSTEEEEGVLVDIELEFVPFRIPTGLIPVGPR